MKYKQPTLREQALSYAMNRYYNSNAVPVEEILKEADEIYEYLNKDQQNV